jgi:hypothetical protein
MNSVMQIPVFTQLPDFNNDDFQKNLKDAFKKAALEAFLYRAARQYKSFQLSTLQEMFGMGKQQLRRCIGQLIIFNRLQMTLDLSKELLTVDEGACDVKELQ